MTSLRLPTNTTQQKIYDVVCASLGREDHEIGIDSDLYRHGLDSLNCTMLVKNLSETFGIIMKLKDVTEDPSVLGLEKVINHYLEETGKRNETAVDLSPREIYPVGPYLMPIIFSFKGNPSGNIPVLYRLHRDIDLLKLKQAIEKALDIHVELKIKIYPGKQGGFLYHRMDDRKVDIPIEKLSDKEWEEKRKFLVRPYQFTEEDDMFRIGIYETEAQNYLFVDISHFIGDGVSYDIFVSDMNAIYCGTPVSPKKYTSFEYTLLKQEEYRRQEGGASNYNYDGEIQGLSMQGRPFVRRDANVSEFPKKIGKVEGVFERISVEKFTEFCRKYSTTENTILILAGSLAMSLYENKKEVVMVVTHNGRDNDLWSRIIGFLVKTCSFKFDLNPEESVLHAILRANKNLMRSKSHDYNCLDPNPLFFKYQDSMFSSRFLGNLPIVVEPVMEESSDINFIIHKDLVKNCYYYNFIYWKSVFDVKQIKIYISLVESVIASIINGIKRVGEVYPQIPKEYLTTSHSLPIETVNEAMGQEFFKSDHNEKNTNVNVHIINQYLQHQVVGGWGDLYVEESSSAITPTFTPEAIIDNPFGEGKLYKTGFTGRILPDGSIHILENDCRYLAFGLCFFPVTKNINAVEKVLHAYDGITKTTIELKYSGNEFEIIAHLFGQKEPDATALKDYLDSKLDPKLIPHKIVFHEKELK